MKMFEPTFAETDKKNDYRNYFRPAKYLIPAAVFAAVLAAGCDPEAPSGGDDTGDDTGDDGNNTTQSLFNFSSPVELTLNGAFPVSSVSYYVFQPALADFDDDGDLDIFLGSTALKIGRSTYVQQFVTFYRNGDIPQSRGISQLNENSDALSDYPYNNLSSYSDPIGPMFTAVGDIDDDGDLEIIATGNSHYSLVSGDLSLSSYNVELFTYNLSSSPPGLYRYSISYGNSVAAPALVDLDDDGDLDLVYGFAYLSSYTFPYDRDVSSSSPVAIQYTLNGGDSSGNAVGDFYPLTTPDGTLVAFQVGSSVSVLPIPSFVDVDDDGDPDMFVTMYSYEGTELKFFRNSGDHDFTEETIPSDFSLLTNLTANYFPAFGDVEGDGDIDIIVGTDEPKLLFIENTTY